MTGLGNREPASGATTETFYDRLGVVDSASAQEIRRAYKALVRQYPPEKHPEEFKRIREAYETLSDAKSRKEYDTRPSPEVERQILAGVAAMEAKNFSEAEKQFKQVLLQSPDLGYVRNLLGLCFMYIDDAEKALAQFQKLIAGPNPAPAWFGNAGHAYHKLKKYDEAVKAFREAIKRSGDSPGDYVIGLVDTLLEQEKYGAAATALDEAIALDGVVDFNDLRYFNKLLEVHVRDRKLPKVSEVTTRILAIPMDEDQKQLTAWRMGGLAAQLVGVGAFSFAAPLAKAANRLQPAEPDFQALSAISAFMAAKEYQRAAKLLDTNKLFQPGGRLADVRADLKKFIDQNEIFVKMTPLKSAPTMFTLNGFGTRLYGNRDYHESSGSHVATLYFVVLFIPVFPLACYRVIDQGGGSWSFIGKVPFSSKEKNHMLIAAAVVAFITILNIITPDPPPPRVFAGSAVTQAGGAAPTSSSKAALKAWLDQERPRVQAMQDAVKQLDIDIENAETELHRLENEITIAERRGATRADPAYVNLVETYNSKVNPHNALIARRRTAYAEYETASAEFNRQVDIYNGRR